MNSLSPGPTSLQFPNCETEPIHLLGEIQAHGVLLAVEFESERIRYASQNAEALLGRPAARLLGSRLDSVLDSRDIAALKARDLTPRNPHLTSPFHCRLAGPEASPALSCCAHRGEALLILELEQAEESRPADDGLQAIRDQTVEKLAQPGTLKELLENATQFLRFVTGYDRVMIYRFHEDEHGEVVAESTDHHEPLLGLHYPAIDIPPPARRHYLLNLIRVISDVQQPQVELLAEGAEAAPLDLSYAKLRGVAPVHRAYLKNMGVRATMSLSLIVDGKLWGLVACHHYAPKALSPSVVHICEVVGILLSAFVDRIGKGDHLEGIVRAEALSNRLDGQWHEDRSLAEVVMTEAPEIRKLFEASFLYASIGNVPIVDGEAPGTLPDARALRAQVKDELLLTDHLASVLPADSIADPLCAGGLYISLGSDIEDFVFLGRPAIESQLTWAAAEEKLSERQRREAERLNPLGSTSLWRETVRGRSAPFTRNQAAQASTVRRSLVSLSLRERRREAEDKRRSSEQEQTRLHRELLQASRITSLSELGAAVAHELNQPLTATMNFISATQRLLTRRPEEYNKAIALLGDAGEQAKRAGLILRRVRDLIERGETELTVLDIGALLRVAVDTALSPQREREIDIRFAIPQDISPVVGDRVQLEQLIFNLTKNAVEAMSGRPEKRLAISVAESDGIVEVAIEDSGSGLAPEVAANLFKPFNTSKVDGMGIGLSLCRTIVEAHGGQIAAESLPEGTVFRFSLPRSPA